jgi:hypothetical protein
MPERRQWFLFAIINQKPGLCMLSYGFIISDKHPFQNSAKKSGIATNTSGLCQQN